MSQRMWMKLVVAAFSLGMASSAAYATDATVIGDAYVNSAHPTTNYGTLSNLYVGNGGTTLIQFDLSSLPAGTTASQIGKATLKLYVNRINTTGTVNVQPVTSAWSESAVTYASAPSLGSPVANFTPTSSGQIFVIDITSLVQGWVSTPSSNFGVGLSSGPGSIVFDSKESGETSHVAYVDMTVVSQGPTGAQGIQGIQGIQGATGAQGNQGIQGIQGATGPIGAQGIQGIQGVTGATGATGLLTPVTPYNQNSTYAEGSIVFYNGSTYQSSIDANLNNAPSNGAPWVLVAQGGATGATGNTGAQGEMGVQGPMGPQGPQGLMGPVGAPGAAGPVGEQGIQGIKGDLGSQGPAGATGPAGPIGPQGVTGSQGPVGNTGAIGPQGSIGPAGPVGASGPAGPVGEQGQMGLPGNQGPQGATGATGATGTMDPAYIEYLSLFNNGNDNGSDLYFMPVGTIGNTGSTYMQLTRGSYSNEMVIPFACTISQLHVAALLTQAGTTAETSTITILRGSGMVAPTATTLTCTTNTINNTPGSVRTCSNTSSNVSLSAGDTLSLKLSETNNTYNSPAVQYSVHFVCGPNTTT